MNFTINQRKELIKLYPYLMPRNIWDDSISPTYDYSFIRGECELPPGWIRLFLLYAKKIKPYLITNGLLNRFRFSDIKEKYGTLRLCDFGAPAAVHRLATIYESFSQYICCQCGDFATRKSRGWICPYCDNCNETIPFLSDKIIYKKHCKITSWDNARGCIIAEYYSFKSLQKEYEKIIKMNDNDFYNYLIT